MSRRTTAPQRKTPNCASAKNRVQKISSFFLSILRQQVMAGMLPAICSDANNFIITLKLRSSNQVKIFVTDSAILLLSFSVRIVLHIIYGGIANSDQNNQQEIMTLAVLIIQEDVMTQKSYTSEQRPDHLTLLLTATRLRGSDVSEVLKYMHTPYSFFPYLNDSSFQCIHSYIRICNHRQC